MNAILKINNQEIPVELTFETTIEEENQTHLFT